MLQVVKRTIEAHAMLPKRGRVLCALSGGADSVALLLALLDLGYDVAACSFDHGIRGARSKADIGFVKTLCEREHVRLHTGEGRAVAHAKERGISLESAARQLRYAFFNEIMSATGIGVTATAHHADDQAETLLMRLTRGAYDGLSGIPYVNGPYVRPLRDVTRAQILDFLSARGQSYVTDETNRDPALPRNRIRLNVMPELALINHAAGRNISRSLALAMDDAACLDRMAADIPVQGAALALSAVAQLHPAIARRVVIRYVAGHGAKARTLAELDGLLALIASGRTGGVATVGGVAFIRDSGAIRPLTNIRAARSGPGFEAPLVVPGVTLTPLGRLTARICRPPTSPKTDGMTQYFDLDKLPDNLVARARRPGDRISPLGTAGSKKLKDLLIDKKIPRDTRDGLLVLAKGSRVLWAAGAAVSGDAAVTKDTARALMITFETE